MTIDNVKADLRRKWVYDDVHTCMERKALLEDVGVDYREAISMVMEVQLYGLKTSLAASCRMILTSKAGGKIAADEFLSTIIEDIRTSVPNMVDRIGKDPAVKEAERA